MEAIRIIIRWFIMGFVSPLPIFGAISINS